MIMRKECKRGNKNRIAGITGTTEIEEIFKNTAGMNMQINAKLEEIAYWRELASKADVIFSVAGMGGKGARQKKSRVEECVCKIAAIEESLKNDMNELIRLKEKAINIIDKVDAPEYRAVLMHRYVCGKKFHEISEAMGYSYSHVMRLHSHAMEAMKKNKRDRIGLGQEWKSD